jgi:hypothetical protein
MKLWIIILDVSSSLHLIYVVSAALNLESQTPHAREVVLHQLLAFVIGFGRRCVEETGVPRGFSLRASAASARRKLSLRSHEDGWRAPHGFRPSGFNGLSFGFVGSYAGSGFDDHSDVICTTLKVNTSTKGF